MSARTGVIGLRVVFGAATLLGFYSALLAYYYVTTFGSRGTDSFGLLLGLNLNYWYAWAIVTPGILWLSRRYPLERGALMRSVPAHLVGVFLAHAHPCLPRHARARGPVLRHRMTSGRWAEEFQRMFFLNFDFEMATYWAIVGLSHALRYHYEAQARALTASRLETRLVEAQLQTLQRQIQPHFLFNTLNTVSALMHRDVEAADAMIARLGDLLRQSIEPWTSRRWRWAHELDFLRKYVDIEQARFQDRLTVTFDIDPGTEDCPVPNFCCSRSSKTPSVTASARGRAGPRAGEGDAVGRSPCNSRCGTTAWAWMPPGCPISNMASGSRIRESRLAHLYGDRHRFVVTSPPQGGLSVAIDIPVDEPAREASAAELMAEGAA